MTVHLLVETARPEVLARVHLTWGRAAVAPVRLMHNGAEADDVVQDALRAFPAFDTFDLATIRKRRLLIGDQLNVSTSTRVQRRARERRCGSLSRMPRIPIEARMVCPHCRVAFRGEWDQFDLGQDADGHWVLRKTHCANCERFVVNLRHLVPHPAEPGGTPILRGLTLKDERTVWPPTTTRTPIPEKVPESLAKDYRAACRVLADSPEASAALSRRCLQHLLVEKAGAKKKDLADQIDEVLASKELPPRLGDDLHAVRLIGNFGAHPIKSKSTGDIVEVELGEAEWNLDVIEGLFQHYYVDEARAQERRAAMNTKLKDAGKPPLP